MKTILFMLFMLLGVYGFCQENSVYVPNAFTPMSDGINDYFKIGHDLEFEVFELQIYNQYGSVVFKTQNPDEVWDGGDSYCAGNMLFVYKLIYRTTNSKEIKIKYGNVTIIK